MNTNTTFLKPVENLHERSRRPAKKHYCSLLIVLALLVIHILSTGINAQTTTSTIEGMAKDPNGAVIAGAQVKAASATLATERTAVTDNEGFFRIVSLPAGTYTLTVTQSGFATVTSNIELLLNRTVALNIRMEVSGVAGSEVTVTSDLPLLTTDSPATGATITPQQIRDLPVNGKWCCDPELKDRPAPDHGSTNQRL